MFLNTFHVNVFCVCIEFKHAGEAMLLESGTDIREKRSAQKTNGCDANSSRQRWVGSSTQKWSHQDVLDDHASLATLNIHAVKSPPVSFSRDGRIKAVTNIECKGLRHGSQGPTDPTAKTHAHTHLHLLSPPELLWCFVNHTLFVH